MLQNTKQLASSLTTPNKTSRNKHHITPGSKHKDRLIIQQSFKKRQSMRKSFHRKIAWMEPVCKPKPKKSRKNRKSDNQLTIDLQLLGRIEKNSSKIAKNDEYIQSLTKKIIQTHQILAQMKKSTQKTRQIYFKHKQLARNFKFQLNKTRQQCYRIRNQTNNIHFDAKKQMFEMASCQFDLTKAIQLNEERASKKQQKLQQIFQQFQSTTELVTTNELKIQDLHRQLHLTQQNFKRVATSYNLQYSQLFVIKFQINCNLIIGMQASANGLQKKVMLDKDYKNWDKTKQKKIQFIDLKRWIILQLYRGWKNILRKLSYQSSQYQVLFGETINQPIMQDLKRFLSQDKIRSSYRKIQKSLIFYSQLKSPFPYKEQLKSQLSLFNNNLIRINNVQFVQFQGNTDLQIHYTYLQHEQLIEKFSYEQHNFVNKDKLLKDLKNCERRIFCIIQIPLAAHKDDIIRYEEVYQIVKKKRGNLATTSQRSLSK